MAAGAAGPFSLREVLDAFRRCVTEQREVLLEPYLSGWRGLIRFLQSLGAVFSFISKDAVAKVALLEGHQQQHGFVSLQSLVQHDPGAFCFLQSLGAVFSFISKDAVAKVALLEGHQQQHGFVSLQSLVQHELAAGPAALRARPDSGCRTVLRLHRALRWLQLFLEGLRSGEPRTSVLCTDAYNASLAQHHPWVVRKAATVAFCTLPSRDAFLEIMNVGSAEEAVAMLGEAIPYIGDVYGITQELFAQHKLLDLP